MKNNRQKYLDAGIPNRFLLEVNLPHGEYDGKAYTLYIANSIFYNKGEVVLFMNIEDCTDLNGKIFPVYRYTRLSGVKIPVQKLTPFEKFYDKEIK